MDQDDRIDRDPTHRAPVRVRVAVPADADALVDLLHQIMAHHGVPFPPDADLRAVLGEAFASTAHEFLVAEGPEGIHGMCALVYSLSTWSAGPVCEVQDVVVAAHRRGAGVGAAVLAAAERRAAERGCRRLFLTAETPNLGGQAFYRALGLMEKTTLHFERDLTARVADGLQHDLTTRGAGDLERDLTTRRADDGTEAPTA